MPELPEIRILAGQMQRELVGQTIADIEVLQPKCLNLPEDKFRTALMGAQIRSVAPHGKWLKVETSQGWLLLNLGMGGEILLTDRAHLPEKYRLVFDLADGAAECLAGGGLKLPTDVRRQALAVNFWWFGYAHHTADLAEHEMTARLGPDFLSLSLAEFRALLRGRRGGIKSFLLNQGHLAGIGNVYVQDPLFLAGIHPLRRINTLSGKEIEALWSALGDTLQESIDHGGSHWEQDLYGQHGGWGNRFFRVAYREGASCPTCGTVVLKIKTGSTHTHICPACQPI
jgi:formamidopyrimidine-DNA glycosylase